KTPCRPGLTPVMKLVQLGNVAGGIVDAKRPCAPASVSRRRFGNVPSAIQGAARSSVAPSKPVIRIIPVSASNSRLRSRQACAHALQLGHQLRDLILLSASQILLLFRVGFEIIQLDRR